MCKKGNKLYFTSRHCTAEKNKAEHKANEFMEQYNNILIRECDVPNLQKEIERYIAEVNAENKRCKDIVMEDSDSNITNKYIRIKGLYTLYFTEVRSSYSRALEI